MQYHAVSIHHHTEVCTQLVSWYFEPSQPQKITSWLKKMFNLSPIYSACKSSNHKLFINHKINPVHKFKLKKTIHKHRTQNFRRISPFGIAPVKKKKKHIRLLHAGIVDHSIDLLIPYSQKYKKRNGQKQ